MKNLMISSALVAAFALPAAAADSAFVANPIAGGVHASDLIGARVYASEAAIDTTEYNGVQQDWNDIGEINDVILTRDGKVDSVLVDIGGFLGIGERKTAVSMSSLHFVSDAATSNDPDDWFLVLTADRATIEGAPEWKVAKTMTDADSTADTTTAPVATAEGTMPAKTMREGYAPVQSVELTSEMLTGATAYDANDKNIGEVADLVLTKDGKITGAVIDVGGFLGMGEKPVEVSLDQLSILRQADGTDLRIYLELTKEELEAMPTYAK